MKTIKTILLYILIIFFLFMGSMHFIQADRYYAMMPSWLPAQKVLIILSGFVEIVLALLLIPIKTRTIAARLIIAMLIIFMFTIHIPESLNYYQSGHDKLLSSLIRLPIQLLFIAWTWMFVNKQST